MPTQCLEGAINNSDQETETANPSNDKIVHEGGMTKKNIQMRADDFLRTFIDAGITLDQVDEIIDSPDNELAELAMRTMFGERMQAALALEQVVDKQTLRLKKITIIPATAEAFVAKEKIVHDRSDDALLKITFIDPSLDEVLFSGDGLIEAPAEKSALLCHELSEEVSNAQIAFELGGEMWSETTLSAAFFLLEQQGRGQSGPLLVDNWWNIFTLRGINGQRFQLAARYDDGWRLHRYSTKPNNIWRSDVRYFSLD